MEGAGASGLQHTNPTLAGAVNILGYTGDSQPVGHDQIPGAQLAVIDVDEARPLAVEQPGVVGGVEPSPQRVDGAPDHAQRRGALFLHFRNWQWPKNPRGFYDASRIPGRAEPISQILRFFSGISTAGCVPSSGKVSPERRTGWIGVGEILGLQQEGPEHDCEGS